MQTLIVLLPYIQIILSVLLVAGILLQQSSAGLGGAFGDNFSSAFHTRRGFEKILFNSTLVISLLFAVSALVNIIISKLSKTSKRPKLGEWPLFCVFCHS